MSNDNTTGTTDNSAILAELARLRAENEAMKAKQTAKQTISFKVSEKGGVSVYGLGRFPVTERQHHGLHRGQQGEARHQGVSERGRGRQPPPSSAVPM